VGLVDCLDNSDRLESSAESAGGGVAREVRRSHTFNPSLTQNKITVAQKHSATATCQTTILVQCVADIEDAQPLRRRDVFACSVPLPWHLVVSRTT
jgi:hypothetical protein